MTGWILFAGLVGLLVGAVVGFWLGMKAATSTMVKMIIKGDLTIEEIEQIKERGQK